MKLHIGSIQRRGTRLYLVTRRNGKNAWFSLKTNDYSVAAVRARKLLPPADEEWAWLAHLSRIGAAAEREMQRRKAESSLTWRGLWDEFLSRAGGTISETSEWSYERWMRILSETAEGLGLSPADISKRESYPRISSCLFGKYLSAKRMIVFYRRVWRTVGLEQDMWGAAGAVARESSGEHEFYRRLSVDEVRSVYRWLSRIHPELADMVAIGYFTGLRLSDVAELDASEVGCGGRFLVLVPNKTRQKKPRPLTIPLVNQAQAIVRRRLASLSGPDGFLFSSVARKRPSRKIAAAFRRCGILAAGNGRASFHSLRATFISLMDEAGVPPHITDSITGHAGGGMHSRYTQPSLEALMLAVSRAIIPL